MTNVNRAPFVFVLAGLAAAALLLLPAAGARAQSRDHPYGLAHGRVTFGGEIAATAAPRDDEAFFNYTDYERNALRMARLRLFGQWRIVDTLSLVGELRTENGDGLDVSALYVRWRPWPAHELDVQAGRIPPVVGAFARRAYGRDNLVIGLPLAYQYLTSLRPDALPATTDDLLRMRARGWRPSFPIGAQTIEPGVPLVSASRWDTGVEARWRRGWLELAGAITRGAPSVPVVRDTNEGRQWSGRAAVHLPAGLTLAMSGARGQWLESGVLALVPENRRDRSMQAVIAADLEFGLGHWLVRAEWIRSAFDLPIVAAPDGTAPLAAQSGFVETRYRWHPRWQLAARAEWLGFSTIAGSSNAAAPTPWDAPVTRMETVVGFRATPAIEIRAGWQQNWRDAGRVRERGSPAIQLLYRF